MRVHLLEKQISKDFILTRFISTGKDAEVMAETETHYKVKIGAFRAGSRWIPKELCEIIKEVEDEQTREL